MLCRLEELPVDIDEIATLDKDEQEALLNRLLPCRPLNRLSRASDP